jgi:imidazolonepropionase-like amidohydrolase
MTIAIRNTRLIDGAGAVLERATVVIRATKIAAVGTSKDVAIPRGATRVDGHGFTLLPGLIDCHVHLCLGSEPDVVGAIARETPFLTLRATPWKLASPLCATSERAITPFLP